MNVLIFNSGFGSRIANLIKDSHKSLLNINGESILSRQLRILSGFEIEKVIITTGPNSDKLIQEISNKNYPFKVVFIHNAIYDKTNYIYSMHLAINEMVNDMLILHGDLVFNKGIIEKLLKSNRDSVLIDKNKGKYLKDFKAVVNNNLVQHISVKIKEFDFGLQPVYFLRKSTVDKWNNKVKEFIDEGNDKVYAEEALNILLKENKVSLSGLLIENDYCQEIDDENDYIRVKEEIKKFDYRQIILKDKIDVALKKIIKNDDRILVVTFKQNIESIKEKLGNFKNIEFIEYNDANPERGDIVKNVEYVDHFNPDTIISIGGGSIIDYSKCIIDFSKITANHIAVPTTCGTGSESTTFAVYYIDGIKQSLNKNYLIPNSVILDSSLLASLPQTVYISSILDAFAQSVESYWSKKSTERSRNYSLEALSIIYPILEKGLEFNDKERKVLLTAANLAGKAINITTTTASHALSYNLTKLFGISHGFAVCMTLPFIWEMHVNKIPDFNSNMEKIINIIDCKEVPVYEKVASIFNKYEVWKKSEFCDNDLEYLIANVNLERLGNNPYSLNKEEIKEIYIRALNYSDK